MLVVVPGRPANQQPRPATAAVGLSRPNGASADPRAASGAAAKPSARKPIGKQ